MSRPLGLIVALAALSGCCPDSRPSQDPFSVFGPTQIEPAPTCGGGRCAPTDPGYRGGVDDGIGPIPEPGAFPGAGPSVGSTPYPSASRGSAGETPSPAPSGAGLAPQWTPRGSASGGQQPSSGGSAAVPSRSDVRMSQTGLGEPPPKIVDITDLPDWDDRPLADNR